MDKKSLKLPPAESKLYHCSGNVFQPFLAPVATHNNEVLKENPQSVLDWKSYNSRNKLLSLTVFRRSRKKKIYIHPIGPYPDYFYQDGVFCANLRQVLKRFIELFFPGMCAVVIDRVIDHRNIRCKTRFHDRSMQHQLYLPDITFYLKQNLPSDAFCNCGFSWFDFYPADDLNHILGEGDLYNRTVAFSFGHYSKFKEKEARQKEWANDFVVEPSIEINDSLKRSFDNDNEGQSSSYVYVTYCEKVEAQNQIEKHEHNCITPPKMSPKDSIRKLTSPIRTSPKLHRLSDKFHSLMRKGRSPRNSSRGSYSETHSLTDDDESEVFEVDLKQDSVTPAPQQNNIVDDNWDTCDDLDEVCMTSQPILSRETEPTLDALLNTTLPPGCEFNLDCKALRRLFRVISHEICHVFGMMHCQYFDCTLNASTSVLHVDKQPLFLCPICLRKLQIALKFDVLHRYKQFDGFLTEHIHRICMCQQERAEQCEYRRQCDLKKDLDFLRNVIDLMTT